MNFSSFIAPTNVDDSRRTPERSAPEYFNIDQSRMFNEAFLSRNTSSPHLGQVHSLSLNFKSLFIYPHLLCILLLGSKRPNSRTFLPLHSDLYLRKAPNMPHPASFIDNASLWFFTMFETLKSSIHTVSYCLVIASVTLCEKSFLWLVIFSCNIANFLTAFLRLLLPFNFLETLRLNTFKRCNELRKCLGLSYSVPSEQTAKVLIPKSIPTAVLMSIGFFVGVVTFVSVNIDTKYLFVGVLLIIALFITPLIGLCKTISIPSLNLGTYKRLRLAITLCGQLKDWLLDFFLKLGNLARPLKKLPYAISKFSNATCNDWLFTSLKNVHSFFNSVNCACKSYLERFTLCTEYADVLVSKAKLYTNLTQPKCLSNKTFWDSLGFNLYLYAFNTVQRYNINLTKQMNLDKNINNFINHAYIIYLERYRIYA